MPYSCSKEVDVDINCYFTEIDEYGVDFMAAEPEI